MHPKQEQFHDGKRYFVTRVQSAKGCLQARQSLGVTEVYLDFLELWVPITEYMKQASRGGDHKSQRYGALRQKPAATYCSESWKLKKRPAADNPASDPKRAKKDKSSTYVLTSKAETCVRTHRKALAFSLQETPVYVVNLPEDSVQRKGINAELHSLEFLFGVTTIRAIKGKSVVSRIAKTSSQNCELTLTNEGREKFGVAKVTVISKRKACAPGVFGCSMSHLHVYKDVLAKPKMYPVTTEYILILEDDARLTMPATNAVTLMNSLLRYAHGRGYKPDIVWLGGTSPTVHSPPIILVESKDVFRKDPWEIAMVRTKHCYGSFAYLVRRASLDAISSFLDPSHLVRTADGALNAAVHEFGLLGAHLVVRKTMKKFEIFTHKMPEGGSRIGR